MCVIGHQAECRDRTWIDACYPPLLIDNRMIVVYCKQPCLDWSEWMHTKVDDLNQQVDHHLGIVRPNSCVSYQYSFLITHPNSLSLSFSRCKGGGEGREECVKARQEKEVKNE